MSQPTQHNEELYQDGLQMLNRGIEFDNIRDSLQKKTSDGSELDAVMKALRDHYHVIRRKRGGILLITGAILLVFGCVLVFALQDSHGLARLMIYLPTVVGSVLVFWGFVDMLGW